MKSLSADYLVIGSGIAGLSFALRTALTRPDARILVVTKNDISESNTRYAQGGLAAVTDPRDSFEQHIEDTIRAGDGLCDPEVVRTVVEETPARLGELLRWGAAFDTNPDNSLHLALEGGHSASRIVHHGDLTGREIEETLVKKVRSAKNIEVLPFCFAFDLVAENNVCRGAIAVDLHTNTVLDITSNITVIACGGIGQVFSHTTNPLVATGDGIAMAWRAGAKVLHMEYVQFHPTALYGETGEQLFLISEAVRGAGAFLLNTSGERFMHRYDEKKELACRDVVCRAIYREMQVSGAGHVWLDCRHLDQKSFREHFPTIYRKCVELSLDPATSLLPVVPAAHYCCGGIETDLHGRTNIHHLYAIGESACTGLHGANRLASNSLPEALVFAARAAASAAQASAGTGDLGGGQRSREIKSPDREQEITGTRKSLQKMMHSVAVLSTDTGLRAAQKKIRAMQKDHRLSLDRESLELHNLLTVSLLIVEASLRQHTNRGTFYKTHEPALSQSLAGEKSPVRT